MNKVNRKIAPKFKQVDSINFLSKETSLLDNKIPLHVISGGSQDILKIDFIFDAGIWFQSQPLVARATNSLLKEGTKNYNSQQIAEGIDQYGAYIQTDCSHDKASITIFTLKKYLDRILPLIEEIIYFPRFEKHEFDIYKKNIIERHKINSEKVSYLARNEFMRQLFSDANPYGRIAELKSFEDLDHQLILNHYNSHYSPRNCEIIVSGKVDSSVITSINNFVGNHHSDENKSFSPVIKNTNHTPNNILIKKEKALQSAIRIGKIMPNKKHPDYFKLQILNTVLGGYFGSRLMKNIREDKGYTYGIGSGILSLQNGGYFFISTEVGVNVTEKTISEIYKEINTIQNELIPNDELELVKNYLLGSLLKSCDGPFKMAALFENIHFYGFELDFYNKYIQTIKNITSSELLETAQNYLNIDSMTEVIVGLKN